jgi:hypothetical protein
MEVKSKKKMMMVGSYYSTTSSSLLIFKVVILSVVFLLAVVENRFIYASIPITTTSNMSDFNFSAVGDWACTSDTVNTVNNIFDKNPELILALGDYSYKTTADCWLQIVDPIDEEMKIVIGNHEVTHAALLQQYMSHFNLTEQYYSFDYQNIHFLAMGTEVPFDTSSEQYDFVNRDLAKAAANPNIDWIVVFLHKMLYSSPADLTKEYQLPLSITYHPVFDKYDVDLVIQAHLHGYERSHPINYNTKSYPNPIVKDSNTNDYINPEAPIFVTVGTGGATIHGFEGKRPYMVTQYSGFGLLNIDVTNNSTQAATAMNATYYANDGSIKDHFTVTKSSGNATNNNNTSFVRISK